MEAEAAPLPNMVAELTASAFAWKRPLAFASTQQPTIYDAWPMLRWKPEEARVAIEAQIEAYTTCLNLLAVCVDRDDIVVKFAVPDRPDCRFGFRWPVAGAPSTIDLEDHAMLARVNLEEWVEAADMALPDCGPGELAWLPRG